MDIAGGHIAEFILEDIEGGYGDTQSAENPGELEAIDIVSARNYIGQPGDGREAIDSYHEGTRAFIK